MMDDAKKDETRHFIHQMIYEKDSFWRQDAALLIKAGMNLQAMDTHFCRSFDLKLKLETKQDKIDAIAEVHRQMLEYMNLPAPARDLDPDPLALPNINEMPLFRGDAFKEGTQSDPIKKSSWYPFTDVEIDRLHKSMQEQRPELLRLIELSWQNWVDEGCPDDRRRSFAASSYDGMEAFVLNQRPDIGSMDAGHACHSISDFYRPGNRTYIRSF